ncbi:outer membrane lipoprotein LolB [Permianibacter sp. IMCC34836]|uniref:lipoprotein insertase outer membrane protein LolB n=1 Tax=Permianibacter fluminis TaxID=2738515 RepID=UPI0015583282|nr:lipoprotein insertase outer membrane protein LolB [Permianibacter fluminis]NQD36946.1 outer membrane lipoprotein LolB [Permianibacter fluminis]
MSSKHLLFAPIAGLLLLAGCAGKTGPTKSLSEQEAAVSALQSWQLDGRIGLKRGNEGFSAGLDWHEAPGDFRFELTGPLGETRARLTGSATEAILELPDHAPIASTDIESLLHDNFGWQLPVNRLRWWVRGLAGPDAIVRSRDAEGRVKQLTADGWQVDYLAWQEVNGLWLPKRLEARNAELSLKLALYDWQL